MIPPKRRILIIDDNQDLLSVLEMALGSFGFKVLTAASGKKALATLASERIDLVIVDYKMPGMDGEVVTRQVRQISPLTPIIMYSGALEEVPPRVLDLVDEFVSKQEPLSSLVHLIARLIVGPPRPRRGLPRFPFRVPFLALDDGAVGHVVFSGESSDLSEGGMGGILDGDLPTGRVVHLQIALGSELAVGMRAAVRYRVGAQYGFQFIDLTPAQRQSIRHSLSS